MARGQTYCPTCGYQGTGDCRCSNEKLQESVDGASKKFPQMQDAAVEFPILNGYTLRFQLTDLGFNLSAGLSNTAGFRTGVYIDKKLAEDIKNIINAYLENLELK
jgi:hypothetical protein